MRAQHADSEEKRLSELAKAKEHFIRAAYDALEARILYSLDRFTKFQEKYSKFVGKEDLPAYIDTVNTAREIRKYLIDVSKKSEYPDFDELKRKAIHLDRQLERLSENRKFLIKSIEKSKHKARHIAILSIVGLIASILSALISLFYPQVEVSNDISTQIRNLSNIQKSLSELQNYVKDQKNLLQILNQDISKLRTQKAELEQVVSLDKDKIELVLRQYEKAQQKRIWLNIFISFIVGVFSSATATLIFRYRKKLKEVPSIDMITKTKDNQLDG